MGDLDVVVVGAVLLGVVVLGVVALGVGVAGADAVVRLVAIAGFVAGMCMAFARSADEGVVRAPRFAEVGPRRVEVVDEAVSVGGA
jgi:hypothetical protein